MQYLLIRKSDGLIDNIIELRDGSKYTPPQDHNMYLVSDIPSASIGDIWNGDILTKREDTLKAEETEKAALATEALKGFTNPIGDIVGGILQSRGLDALTEKEKDLLNNALITLSSRGLLPVK